MSSEVYANPEKRYAKSNKRDTMNTKAKSRSGLSRDSATLLIVISAYLTALLLGPFWKITLWGHDSCGLWGVLIYCFCLFCGFKLFVISRISESWKSGIVCIVLGAGTGYFSGLVAHIGCSLLAEDGMVRILNSHQLPNGWLVFWVLVPLQVGCPTGIIAGLYSYALKRKSKVYKSTRNNSQSSTN